MSSTLPAPAVSSIGASTPADEKALRAQARRRACFCPGAGWALLGYPARGNLVLLSVVGCVATVVSLILTLSPASIWAVGISTPLAFAIWTAELLDTAWCRVRPQARNLLVSRFAFTTIVVWGLVLMTPLLVLRWFGAIDADIDDRMSPGIEPGEQLVFHRRVRDADLKRGTVIVFKLQRTARGGTTGEQVIARILAAPDDELTVRNGHYVVNGEMTRYRARTFDARMPLQVPAYPRKLIVPPARYFVVQDSLETGIDSQQLDYARQIDMVSTRLFHFARGGLLRAVE
ncbi:MAG TPA: signal peptidase I [Pirellulales bacterium]|nr:signal peptidase I [Pirellulales bacterium]